MAIEAARQIASAPELLKGYRLTDVVFLKPLMSTTKNEGFETQISLRRLPCEVEKALELKTFAIYTYEDGDWTENCRGTIALKYINANVNFEHTKESNLELERCRQILKNGTGNCNHAIDSVRLYRRLESIGLSYGSKFRVLEDVRYGDNEAMGTVKLRAWAADVEQTHYQEQVIHPTALDGLFQLSLATLIKRSGKNLTTIIPKYVRSVWITSQCLSKTQNTAVKAHAKRIQRILGGSEFTILALENNLDETLVSIKGLQTADLGILTKNAPDYRKRITFGFEWKQDMDRLNKQQLQQYCIGPAVEPCDQLIEDIEFMCFSFLTSTLEVVACRDTSDFKPHFQRYIRWVQYQRERYIEGELVYWRPHWPALSQDRQHTEKIINHVEKNSAEGELYAIIGKNLLAILEGEADALDLMFTNDLATRFYQEANGTLKGLETIKPYIDALAHKTPGLKVLEIGAGTGSATGFMLDVLNQADDAEFGALRYESYTFTDISSGFFEKANQRFKKYSDHMVYATLDIEQDPLEQGFQGGEYDVVLAVNVSQCSCSHNFSNQMVRVTGAARYFSYRADSKQHAEAT